jgi:hypothetical protein
MMEQICVVWIVSRQSLDLNCRNLLGHSTSTSSCHLLKREGWVAFRQPAAVALKKEDPGPRKGHGGPRLSNTHPMNGWVLLYFQVTVVTRSHGDQAWHHRSAPIIHTGSTRTC